MKDDKQNQNIAIKAKEKKPWSKRKAIIFWSVGIVASLGVGVGVGYILSSVFNSGTVGNYDNINVSKYAVDYDALVTKYQSLPEDTDYSKNFTPAEMANLSLSLLHRQNQWEIQGYGKTTFHVFGVSGDQIIRSTFIRDGQSYFEESLSKSNMVQAAWRMYEDYDKGDQSTVSRYSGTITGEATDASFASATPTQYSRQDYYQHAGRYLDGIPCIYIISDKCLSPESQKTTSGIATGVQKTDDGYVVELELNPQITVKNYVLQMQATTDLAGPPTFQFVHLTFHLDSKLQLISMRNYESYYAKTAAGAGSNLIGDVTSYVISAPSSIPELNTPTSYDVDTSTNA